MPDAVAPEISSLVQPSPSAGGPMPPPVQPDAPAETMTPAMAQPNVTPAPGINPAQAPPAPAQPVRHQVLARMVQGLADGLSGFSAGIASKGKVSGAEVVQNLEAQRAETQQKAVAATQAQRDAELRNKLTTAQTNEANSHNILLNATLPDEISKSHLTVSGEQQRQAITGADFQASHGGMSPVEFSTAMSSAAPVNGQGTSANPFFMNQAQSTLRAAKASGLPDTNPVVQNMQTVLANSTATAKDVYTATQQLAGEQERQSKAIDEQTKREAAAAGSPVAKLSTPEALAAPGSQAAIQAKIDDPTTNPADVPRLRALLPQAAVAQLNAANIKAREQRNQQIVNQGDPDEAGRLLANRSLTLGELKSRQVTPKFIADAITSAQKYDLTYKAAEAEAQGKIAASPANSQFFGNTDSLLVKGGTLDQLSQTHAALGNTSIPFANKLENWRKAALGQGPQAAFAAAALGVADDGSKVMAGGTGSDASRQQFLDIIGRDLSPAGMAASIAQVRKQIESQRNGRIGTNPYLRDMFPDPSTRQETPGIAGTQAATGSAPSGKAVSLRAAMALPVNAGKTADQVRADIQAHGHQVGE